MEQIGMRRERSRANRDDEPPGFDARSATDIARRQAALFAGSADARGWIAQEAVARAWESRHRFRQQSGTLESWIFGIVRNVAREHQRAEHRDQRLWRRISAAEPPATTDPDVAEVEEIRRAFVRLSHREQEILYLRYWEDLPYSRIAERMLLKEATCRQISRRAIMRLGRLLE